jgi:hypothetical protein
MDLQAELTFQTEQLAGEERQLAELQQMLTKATQQVLFRRGCVAQVERLLEMQEKGEGESA